ncbi:MAG: SAM-dependent methyltransferase, partial [Planctomycetaceae bacterium]|nr:SAM-dependent methyltransferase [Planctomycetaceae bacterium]
MDKLFDTLLSKEENLLKRFEEIHDCIYANDGLSPQQTLEEIVKVLFIKLLDENKNLKQFVISDGEWNRLKTGNTVPSFSDRMTSLFDNTQTEYQDVFEKDDRIKLSPLALGYIVNKLQRISLLGSSQDAKGLAFQKFLSHHEKEGRGQFFTPEPVMDFCVAMMQPQPDETMIDPACGSGGFLTSALKYLQTHHKNLNVSKTVSQNIFGVDINRSIARIAKMKLLLEANEKTNIFCTNSLEDYDNKWGNTDGFDLILTNPPFGAKITQHSVLSKYDLGYKWTNHENKFYKSKTVFSNQNAEILFIERCLQLLKEGGRMGIVLPNGNFENPSLEYLRNYIKSKAKVLAVIH